MLIALIAFIVLLAFGVSMGELRWTHVGLWIIVAVGAFVLVAALQWPAIIYYSMLAAMDIVLILVIFKGDIRIR